MRVEDPEYVLKITEKYNNEIGISLDTQSNVSNSFNNSNKFEQHRSVKLMRNSRIKRDFSKTENPVQYVNKYEVLYEEYSESFINLFKVMIQRKYQ